MLMLSGPVELFVLLDLIASKTCNKVIVMLNDWRFFVCLSMSLFYVKLSILLRVQIVC